MPVDLFKALALPTEALVDRRVPKKLLTENSAPTAKDKRLIREGIEELRWIAALKPTTIGVTEYRDAVREYLEIAVLRLVLRSDARAARLTKLVHRAVPYPTFLFAWFGNAVELSLAHKRWSRSDSTKTVIDDEIVSARLAENDADQLVAEFSDTLALSRQPRGTLHALYQGWIDTVLALRAAEVTGAFSLPASASAAADRATALRECRHLSNSIAQIRAMADKEKQLRRRVEMNLKLARLRTDLDAMREKL